MTRNLKSLGLALFAVLAISAVVASNASATTDALVSEAETTTLTGTQENGLGKMTLAGQAVECTNISGMATMTFKTVVELESEEPVFTGCTYAGQPMTVTMNGCKYRGARAGATDSNGHLHVSLVCPAGKKVVMTLNAIACSVTIAEQEGEEGYTVTTVGAGTSRELTVHLTLKTKVTSVGDPGEGVTCASLTNGTATQEGTGIVKGENKTTGVQIGITDESF
jgi:hypothetical protein